MWLADDTHMAPEDGRNVLARSYYHYVRGHGGPYSCETSRLPHFIDNWLTAGGEVVSLTRRPPFTHRKIPGAYFS
jgi:hypothetical protein